MSPAQSPLIASEGKCQALLLSLTCHFHWGLRTGRWCMPHLSSSCKLRFLHSLVHPCRLSEVLPHLSATAATGHTQHSWSCVPVPAAEDSWAGGMPEHGAASGDCAIQFVLLGNSMLSGRPVISPAVIGMYLVACHASLYTSAETEAGRSVQTEGPNLPFLLHKNKSSRKKKK